jgi:cytochrome c556
MPTVTTGQAVTHAVHDERLRDVMREMPGGSFERLPQELDDPRHERPYLDTVSSRAAALAEATTRIGTIVDQVGLTPDERRLFLDLVDALRDRARQLQEQADRGQTRLIEGTMHEIDDTCSACHQLFRAMPPSEVP